MKNLSESNSTANNHILHFVYVQISWDLLLHQPVGDAKHLQHNKTF